MHSFDRDFCICLALSSFLNLECMLLSLPECVHVFCLLVFLILDTLL